MKKDLTAGEVWAATEALETVTATLLGRFLFEFSRLDVALGLCLVWASDGSHIEILTPKITALTFHKKLDRLAELVEAKFTTGSQKQAAWALWIEQAHSTRILRNQLTHGRWDVDPYTEEAINVIGLPTSPDQRAVRLTLEALSGAVADMGRLQRRLSQLRKSASV